MSCFYHLNKHLFFMHGWNLRMHAWLAFFYHLWGMEVWTFGSVDRSFVFSWVNATSCPMDLLSNIFLLLLLVQFYKIWWGMPQRWKVLFETRTWKIISCTEFRTRVLFKHDIICYFSSLTIIIQICCQNDRLEWMVLQVARAYALDKIIV